MANLSRTSLIVANTFCALPYAARDLRPAGYTLLADRANAHLRAVAPPHAVFADLSAVVACAGLAASFDFRLFNSSKALYTNKFFLHWTEQALPAFMSACGKAKKALVFDCDNTLWKGILGEDGVDGIDMSRDSTAGRPFFEVQQLVLALQQQGVLIGLCSKNNPDDVDDILTNHPDMQIRPRHLAGRRINWDDKVTSLKSLAAAWNIGLDSIVFVDDSDFELGHVRSALPEITAVKVPSRASDYPSLIHGLFGLFFQLTTTREDREKTALYQQDEQRTRAQAAFTTIDAYLRSLELKLRICDRPASVAARLAQLTQKTNQFNLTTRRYTEADITRFIASERHLVLAFSAADRYGDHGVTGMAVVEFDATRRRARIDTLLMSCRIIGRNLEFAFLNELVRRAGERGAERIDAEYLKTPKNAQVADYFERGGFTRTGGDGNQGTFVAAAATFAGPAIDYIRIENLSDLRLHRSGS